jgi:hypothetical protein
LICSATTSLTKLGRNSALVLEDNSLRNAIIVESLETKFDVFSGNKGRNANLLDPSYHIRMGNDIGARGLLNLSRCYYSRLVVAASML